MAKKRGKSFADKLARQLKQSMGAWWSDEGIQAINQIALQGEAPALDGTEFSGLVLRPCLTFQHEMAVRDFDEQGKDFDDLSPFVYPELMRAWERYSVSVEFSEAAASVAFDSEPGYIQSVPLAGLQELFPGCLALDVRKLGVTLYNIAVDVVFVYPSYNALARHVALMFVGVNQSLGFTFAYEARLVLKGATFGDAARETNRVLDEERSLCLGGLSVEPSDEFFSALDSEPELFAVTWRLLAVLCSDRVELVHQSWGRGETLKVRPAKPESQQVVEGVRVEGEPGADGGRACDERAGVGTLAGAGGGRAGAGAGARAGDGTRAGEADGGRPGDERAGVGALAGADGERAGRASAGEPAGAGARAGEADGERAGADKRAAGLEGAGAAGVGMPAQAGRQCLPATSAMPRCEGRQEERPGYAVAALDGEAFGSGCPSGVAAPTGIGESAGLGICSGEPAYGVGASFATPVSTAGTAPGEPDFAGMPVSCAVESSDSSETALELELLHEEVDRLRAELDSQKAAAAYREGQLAQQASDLREQVAALRVRSTLMETMNLPETPLEALQLAERAFADRIIVLPRARKSAEEFVKGDPGEVWAVLRSVAVTLHSLLFCERERGLANAFRDRTGYELALRDAKGANRNAAQKAERMVMYEGTQRDATMHIKGRGTRKGESLRVHFFVDYDKKKIVIVHCGEHLTTDRTSSM